MRRIAWNALRSCSDDSAVMCADSDGQLGAERVDPLAVRLEHGRDRALGEPVDLDVRAQLAQLAGDRDVALRVARGRWGRRCTARAAGGPARGSTSGVVAAAASAGRWRDHWTVSCARDRTKSRMSRLARTGWRPGIMWSPPSTTTSGAPVSSARRRARAMAAGSGRPSHGRGPSGSGPRGALATTASPVERRGRIRCRRSSPPTEPSSAHSTASSIAWSNAARTSISPKKNRAKPG